MVSFKLVPKETISAQWSFSVVWKHSSTFVCNLHSETTFYLQVCLSGSPVFSDKPSMHWHLGSKPAVLWLDISPLIANEKWHTVQPVFLVIISDSLLNSISWSHYENETSSLFVPISSLREHHQIFEVLFVTWRTLMRFDSQCAFWTDSLKPAKEILTLLKRLANILSKSFFNCSVFLSSTEWIL